MGYVVENQHLAEGYVFETRMEAGAKIYAVIAGFLFPVMGLGLLGNEVGGTWLALAGVVIGGIAGVAFNTLFSHIAKWASLIALAGVIIYGTIISFI